MYPYSVNIPQNAHANLQKNLLTKVMMDSSRLESASFFNVSCAFCSLKPILWKSAALSITDRVTTKGETKTRCEKAAKRRLALRGSSHMQEKNYKLCNRATRSRRLDREWPGCLAEKLRDSRKLSA